MPLLFRTSPPNGRNVPASVKHAQNLDADLMPAVEDDVPPNGKATDFGAKVGPSLP
jgi:hypothetical protein